MYFFFYSPEYMGMNNIGLLNNRTAGIIVGCVGQLGGLLMILIGIACDCRTNLQRLTGTSVGGYSDKKENI